jgi:2'-5' RNA ligase
MARLRTFLGIELNRAVRDHVVTLQESLVRSGADVKWVEPDNLHLTLLFLGEVNDREVLDVCRAVAACCAEHERFTMRVEGLGAFPNTRRPRVVWVGVTDGSERIVAIHHDIEETLLDLGCYRREERQYTPHVTLGRVKQASDELSALLIKKADWNGGDVAVGEVLVMSSELSSKGPTYSVLSRAKLKA